MDDILKEILENTQKILDEDKGIELGIKSMDQNGRITIPKSVRETLGIKDSTNFKISVKNGKIILEEIS